MTDGRLEQLASEALRLADVATLGVAGLMGVIERHPARFARYAGHKEAIARRAISLRNERREVRQMGLKERRVDWLAEELAVTPEITPDQAWDAIPEELKGSLAEETFKNVTFYRLRAVAQQRGSPETEDIEAELEKSRLSSLGVSPPQRTLEALEAGVRVTVTVEAQPGQISERALSDFAKGVAAILRGS